MATAAAACTGGDDSVSAGSAGADPSSTPQGSPDTAAPKDPGPTATSATPTSPVAPTTTTAVAATTTTHDGSPAVFVQHGSGARAEVALTFHTNGDPSLATQLLDRLVARRAPVTAFVVGNWLREHPDLGHRLVAEGHELANHTWSHQTMGQLDRPTIATEIAGCVEVLATYLDGPSRWFRPSGMEIASDDVLVEAGLAGYPTVVGYNVDSLDFTDPGPAAVRTNVNGAVRAGDVVSLHFGHPDTLAAIDDILDHLEGQGLRPVTLSTLLT